MDKTPRSCGGVYNSGSCPFFLLCFVAPGYCHFSQEGGKRCFVLKPLIEEQSGSATGCGGVADCTREDKS